MSIRTRACVTCRYSAVCFPGRIYDVIFDVLKHAENYTSTGFMRVLEDQLVECGYGPFSVTRVGDINNPILYVSGHAGLLAKIRVAALKGAPSV